MNKTTIIDEFREYVKGKEGYTKTTAQIKSEMNKKFNRTEGSIIPTDFCYNSYCKGGMGDWDKRPKFFIKKEKGLFEIVGEGYNYNGPVENCVRS